MILGAVSRLGPGTRLWVLQLSIVGWLLWIVVVVSGLVFGLIWVLVEILEWITGSKD